MPVPAVTCVDRELLLTQHRADLRVYVESAMQLETSEDFEVDYANAERARLTWEQSRAALNAHVAEHQCDIQTV